MLLPIFVKSQIIKKSSATRDARCLHIIIPHRLNWPLTTATMEAFRRLTTGGFSITVVVNFDEVPPDWKGFSVPNLSIVKNDFTLPGRAYRKFFHSENGSMFNALGISRGIENEPTFEWTFIAHSDSAPLIKGWNCHFEQGLNGGLIVGNSRDLSRVFAAHSSGTLFNQREFISRNGSVWPKFRFGNMQYDVSDGITLALHKGPGPVPVLPNTLQTPALAKKLDSPIPHLYDFASNSTLISFSADEKIPVFAHMGRGTPRSQSDPTFSHKLPVDYWINMLDSIN